MSKRNGFTLIELLVVVTITVLLVALLIPATESAFAQAVQLRCMTNQRVMIQANLSYSNESRGWYVPIKSKHDLNNQYVSWVTSPSYVAAVGLSPGRPGWVGNWWPGGHLACPVAPAYRPDPSNGKPRVHDTLAFNWGGVSDRFG